MQPEGLCTKTGDRVLEVLHAKHPEARPLSAACLDAYPGPPPEMVPVDITDNMVSAVAGRLSARCAESEEPVLETDRISPPWPRSPGEYFCSLFIYMLL